MKRITTIAVSLALACAPKPAAPPTDGAAMAAQPATLGDCIKAVEASHGGTIVKLEGKDEDGKPNYEFNVKSPDGKEWDVECDPATAKIVEVEEEVSAVTAPAFSAKMKVSEADARKTVSAKYPGEITEIEYEIEANGDATYEIDVRQSDGTEMKVEVDAATGKIVEEDHEIYQIGVE